MKVFFVIFILFITLYPSASNGLGAEAEEQCVEAIRTVLTFLKRFSTSQIRQAFIHVAAAQKYGKPLVYRGILDKSVHNGLVAIAKCGKRASQVPCLQDPSMPAPPSGQRIFFASNLRDNAPLMPHYITQMLFTVTTLSPGSAFVSIYESGSSDATGRSLTQILSELCNSAAMVRSVHHLNVTPGVPSQVPGCASLKISSPSWRCHTRLLQVDFLYTSFKDLALLTSPHLTLAIMRA